MSSRGEIATKAIVLLVIHLVIAALIILFIAKGIYAIFDKPAHASDKHELERFSAFVQEFVDSDEQTAKTFLVEQPNIFVVAFPNANPIRIIHERDPRFDGGMFESNIAGPSICSFKNPNSGGGLETIGCIALDGYRLFMVNKPIFGMKIASSTAGVFPLTINPVQGGFPFLATPATGVGGIFEKGDIYKSVGYLVNLEKRQTSTGVDVSASLSR